MREIKDLHEPFIIWLRERGVPYIYHRGDRKSGIHSGHPDFTLLWMGRTVMIECKTPSGSLSAIQIKRIDFLQRAGNRVEIAFTLEQCVEAAQSILCDHGAPETLLPQQNGSPGGQATFFDRCVERKLLKDLSIEIRCKKGLWSVSGRTDIIEQEAMNYWRQYFEDGEYDDILGRIQSKSAPNFRVAKILGQDWVIAPDQDGVWSRIRVATAADIINLRRATAW